jgi:outer membrane lipoprotein-sorting protein
MTRLAWFALPLSFAVLLAPGPARAADPELQRLLDRIDDLFRGTSSEATLSMHIKTSSWERNLKLSVKSQGKDKALIKILEPAKEKGITTLRVGDNLWNYLPKVDRTIKVPAAMMSSSWMGSHFTNDDLVKESRLTDDYDATVTTRPQDHKGLWVITLVPKPNAPVVWGKLVAKVDAADELPTEETYYDEKGKLVRTLTFSDVKTIDGRRLPTTLTLVPTEHPGEETTLHYDELHLGVELPESTFGLQALRE